MRGININKLNKPTIANNSDALAIGRRQWFLAIRNATDTNGAVCVVVKRNENVAA
jgi:hypothetical protein